MQLTRFLPEGLLEHFERISLQPAAPADPPVAAIVSADIRWKIASMWA